MEAGATSLKGMRIPMPEQVRHDVEQGDLANLDLQDAILAFSDVVALAKAMQLHLGLPSGHVIREADEISVHVKQHNLAGAVKRVAAAVEFHRIPNEDGRQCSAIAIFRKASLTKFFWGPATFRHQCIAIFLYRAT